MAYRDGETVMVGDRNKYRAQFQAVPTAKGRYTVFMIEGPDQGRQITVPSGWVAKIK